MPRSRVSRSQSVSAPVGGWNARDPLDIMEGIDCVRLVNAFPDTQRVCLRKGFRVQSTGMGPGAVQTLAEYNAASGTRHLIAGSANKLWNASAFGLAATNITGAQTVTNNRWQTTNFRTSATNYLVLCNGVNPALTWNGTTLAAAGFTGPASPEKFIHVNVYKRRLYFVEDGTTSFWYAAADAITGATTQFDVGTILTKGGALLYTATWSKESTDNLDDLFVIVSNTGEVLIYSGDNPGAADWQLVGRFETSTPLGRRSVFKLGGEPHLITSTGIVPLSALLNKSDTVVRLTDKIRSAFSAAAVNAGNVFGWEAVPYYRGYSLYVNVPLSVGVSYQQFVMNLLNGSWCNFTGMNAQCWGTFNDKLYFGGNDGVVYEADAGQTDNGSTVNFEIKQAFNYLGDRETVKRFIQARPVLTATPGSVFSFDVDTDFSDRVLETAIMTEGSTASLWGTALWGTALWTDEQSRIVANWYYVRGIGRSVSLRFRGQAKNISFCLNTTNILYEPGGIF